MLMNMQGGSQNSMSKVVLSKASHDSLSAGRRGKQQEASRKHFQLAGVMLQFQRMIY